MEPGVVRVRLVDNGLVHHQIQNPIALTVRFKLGHPSLPLFIALNLNLSMFALLQIIVIDTLFHCTLYLFHFPPNLARQHQFVAVQFE